MKYYKHYDLLEVRLLSRKVAVGIPSRGSTPQGTDATMNLIITMSSLAGRVDRHTVSEGITIRLSYVELCNYNCGQIKARRISE